MFNYDEITTKAQDHRNSLLAEAEQWRFMQSLDPRTPHPIFAWAGRCLMRWGEQLRGEGQAPVLPNSRTTFTR